MFIYLLSSVNEGNLSNSFNIVGQFLQIAVSLVLVIFLSIFVTKLFSKTSQKRGANCNIRIIESIGAGYQSAIQLIQVGNKYLLIGVTKERITLLADIDENDININEPEKIQFDKYLQKFIKKDKQSDE